MQKEEYLKNKITYWQGYLAGLNAMMSCKDYEYLEEKADQQITRYQTELLEQYDNKEQALYDKQETN